ncbi:EF-hand calcium-binding domain-containing protein 14-like isoform X1 [Oratosquilla oratoria]|uniref:EF-hand calcium-binding domain-containing protein 14-like isoform X1 n=1 Tax=Oratosquilla oratoria TaxID=337810 RepID=UPI003F76F73B
MSGSLLNNNSAESYELLNISGSDSDNDIMHFVAVPPDLPPPGQQRKKRLKRKERDLLRTPVQTETYTRWPPHVCRSLSAGPWEVVRSVLLVMTLTGLSVVSVLAVHLQQRIDATQLMIEAVESSSSELPAKFHESHVRLQELEKNQTSMWETINQISTSLTQLTKQVAALEEGVQGIKASLSNAPQLSSLPKDVQALQDSVSTFGSSIQDVQSSLKVMAKQHQQLDQDLRKANTRIDTVKEESHKEVAARSSLQEQVQTIHGDIDSVNATVATHVQIVMPNLDKLKEKEKSLEGAMSNLTQQLTELEGTCKQLHPDMLVPQLNNASALITQLQHTTSQHANLIKNITQTVDMVKGVEKKLEGSQVQMASTVGDLTLRISNIDKRVSRLAEPTTTSPPSNASENHKRTQRLSEPPGDSGAEGP